MADITTQLQAILDAVYGEEVRTSIYTAIDLINKVGEKNLAVGTSVTSSASSTTGYYQNSLYINSQTGDLWQCVKGAGSTLAWQNMGNIRGANATAGAWVFETEQEWNAFNKTLLQDDDQIIFLWDRTSTGDGQYMAVNDYVGSSATGIVNNATKATNATKLENHAASYFAPAANLGSLKFRINNNAAQYSKDGGTTWANFRNPAGTATANKVLAGETFANTTSDNLTGTMVNRGAFTGEITEKDGTIQIPEGYHNGNGSITATYQTGVSYCFLIEEDVTTVTNKDIQSVCDTILEDYGVDIDASELTSDNFLIGNYTGFDTKWGTLHTEGTDGRHPYNLREGASLQTPSVSYSSSTKKLNVGTAVIGASVELYVDNDRFPWGYSEGVTYCVYLIKLPE